MCDLQLEVLNEEVFLPYAPLMPLADAVREVSRWEPRKEEWGEPMCEYKHHQAVVEAHQQPLLGEGIRPDHPLYRSIGHPSAEPAHLTLIPPGARF